MDEFNDYLTTIEQPESRQKMMTVLSWITTHYPHLTREIKWNQPMFIQEGTFILALSASKFHFSVSPEFAGMAHFSSRIKASGYSQSSMLFRIKWTDEVDYQLLGDIIEWNMVQKKGLKTFWRAS